MIEAIWLRVAMLCVPCDAVVRAANARCPLCGAEALVALEPILNGRVGMCMAVEAGRACLQPLARMSTEGMGDVAGHAWVCEKKEEMTLRREVSGSSAEREEMKAA